jgi:DNA-binding MarR family transcriptional regulator
MRTNNILDIQSKTGHELAMSLRCAYIAMHRATNACLIEFDTTADSFTLLTMLAEHGAMPQKQLVEMLNSDANTISAMLNRLENDQLINRMTDENDKRYRIVDLTEKGKILQRKLWQKSNLLREKLENLFEPNEIDRIFHELKKISEVFTNPLD